MQPAPHQQSKGVDKRMKETKTQIGVYLSKALFRYAQIAQLG
jgi:hypothetical protein